MSDLQKQRVKAAMHSVMAPPPLLELNELDEEDHYASTSVPNVPQDDDSSSASSVSSTGTVIPSPGRALFARPQGVPRGRSFDPVPWTTYFERELFLPSPDGSVTYHAYLTSPAPPSAPGKAPGPLFVTHHGAGSSGLSFAVLSAEIRKRLPSAGILSLDARGHGLTTTSSSSSTVNENEPEDLTLPTLAHDLLTLLSLTKSHLHWPTLPPLLLIGHSLGGAVVTEFASTLLPSLPRSSPPTPGFQLLSQQEIDLLGYAVLDVVEGSAMDALQSMHAYLATRPAGFDSLRDAIEWHVRTRTVRNGVSARASVPGLLVHCEQQQQQSEGDGGRRDKAWRWRTDLARTQPFWEGWFRGLSGKFLRGKGGKMLLLAGTDRLDTELTIGQMQGKYALQVFPEAGHFIHEDLPEKTAMALVDFHRRNDRSALVLPPKVSELLAQGKKV